MVITLIIVAGVIVVTVVGAYFDYLGKKAKDASPALVNRIDTLERRLDSLDAMIGEKDERIQQLEHEVKFVNKLLDKKG